MSETIKALAVSRSVSVIYADDIREEVAGKLTIVGVYQGNMIFPAFPAVVPKLAIFLTVTCSANDPFEKLSVRILKGQEPIFEKSLSEAELQQLAMVSSSQPDTTEPMMVEANFLIVTGPIAIHERCVIRAEVLTENGMLPAKNLVIEAAQGAAPTHQPEAKRDR